MSSLNTSDGDDLMRQLGSHLDKMFDTIRRLAADTVPSDTADVDEGATELADD
jgi:hypothetical protein